MLKPSHSNSLRSAPRSVALIVPGGANRKIQLPCRARLGGA
ncbi:MAG: hypothetical protein Q8Q81_01225 [Oxalobacteraceae bacterium]|nr:hypothetical protein [Oxalobacteraceae bacterium]